MASAWRNELAPAPADYATVRREGSALFRREGTEEIAGDEWRVCFKRYLQNTDDFAQATPDNSSHEKNFFDRSPMVYPQKDVRLAEGISIPFFC